MGNSITQAREEARKLDEGAVANHKVLEADMATMSVILDAKEEHYRMKLVTPNSASKTIPIDTIISMKSGKRLNATMGLSSNLNNVVEDTFGGSFLSAMKGMVLGALNSVIGSNQIGEKEKVGMTVLLLHSAVVRCDYVVYAYTSKVGGGATDKTMNGLVFVATLSTVKLSHVNTEAIALLSGLTAEQSLAHINRLRNKLMYINNRIYQNKSYYTVPEAIGLLRGYVGDHLTDEDRDEMRKWEGAKKDRHGNDYASADLPNKDEARIAANAKLSALATEHSVEKSEDQDVMKKQQELLETMTVIYDKISVMKKSTKASITAGDGVARALK